MTVHQQIAEQPAYLRPYSRAAHEYGAGFRALLWASRHTQELRFDAMLRLSDPKGLRVLDLGCGCGDLLDYLRSREASPSQYVGIEGVAELAEIASRRHAHIVCADFIAQPWRIREADADIVYCSGALNTLDDPDFHNVLRVAFDSARRGLVFNFLSSPLLAGETYLRWRYRRDVLSFVRSMSRTVEVLEDYLEGDCTIAMWKDFRVAGRGARAGRKARADS